MKWLPTIILALATQSAFAEMIKGVTKDDCKQFSTLSGTYKMKSGQLIGGEDGRLVVWLEGCVLKAYMANVNNLQRSEEVFNIDLQRRSVTMQNSESESKAKLWNTLLAVRSVSVVIDNPRKPTLKVELQPHVHLDYLWTSAGEGDVGIKLQGTIVIELNDSDLKLYVREASIFDAITRGFLGVFNQKIPSGIIMLVNSILNDVSKKGLLRASTESVLTRE